MNGYKLQFWKWFNSVLLGYSPDGVEGFIDASNKSASPPSEELDEKSRSRLKKLGDNYERHNEDFICWSPHLKPFLSIADQSSISLIYFLIKDTPLIW